MRLPILTTFATTAALLLSACGSAPATGQGTDPAPVSSRCNAAPAQFAVGRNADAALENEARTRAGAKAVRVLRPNQVVTMEFNAERLNLTVDDAGRVTRVNCG
ncbi:starvation-inducible outer membrane lipoprotein [Polaromonas sp. CF318]|uniref:I78 family peptidase inhibitor n=1 Tax=Polaromonas sp. CF318 TaxID=1144318 RepID=UPI0002714CD8|nr:I78 family peptidase inhibitor [Polaromonas sp. CF318]EJL77385.1 starvation-inducible outer membrane lipoprotein [Polaromonas sp. CF318]